MAGKNEYFVSRSRIEHDAPVPTNGKTHTRKSPWPRALYFVSPLAGERIHVERQAAKRREARRETWGCLRRS